MESADQATRLEGRVAQALGRRLVSFQRTVGSKGVITGEIDVETTKSIIEMASGGGKGKLAQIQELLTNPALNPTGKDVVVSGPELSGSLEKALQD